MLKTIFLVRHAKSSWTDPTMSDFDRPLNQRGMSDAPTMAALIHRLDMKPDLIVSSPAVRALTTARIFAQTMGLLNGQFVENHNIYEASQDTILKIIRSLPHDAQTVFMFGHNYTFTDLAQRFSDDHPGNIPTCGVVQIKGEMDSWADFDYPTAKVIQIWRPKDAEY
jgi:phosphohistidine phosphatase